MCGLQGLLLLESPIHGKENIEKLLRTSLILGATRGEDATGLMWYDRGINYYKKAWPSYDFINYQRTKEILQNAHFFKFAVGHTRWKTMGANNDNNAHPFTHEHITLVHNGTISNKYQLSPNRTFDTDSETIAYAMATYGEKETLEKLVGAFALIWFNSKNNTLNFVRNKERPLILKTNKQKTKLVFASEAWQLSPLDKHLQGLLPNVYTLTPLNWFSIDITEKTFEKAWKSPTKIKEHQTNNDYEKHHTKKHTVTPMYKGPTQAVRKLMQEANIPQQTKAVKITNMTWEGYTGKTADDPWSINETGKILAVTNFTDPLTKASIKAVMHGVKLKDFLEVKEAVKTDFIWATLSDRKGTETAFGGLLLVVEALELPDDVQEEDPVGDNATMDLQLNDYEKKQILAKGCTCCKRIASITEWDNLLVDSSDYDNPNPSIDTFFYICECVENKQTNECSHEC